MKKIMIFLFIFTIFLPIVYAEVKIFAGKVMTDTDKDIEGNIFKFFYDDKSNKVFVQTPNTNFIVDNGGCKSNAAFRVCINGANFSYKDTATYKNYYELDVIVYKLTGSLSATSAATPNTLLLGESAEFKITITNPTDFDITNVVYKEDLTPFFATNVKGCAFDGSSISWEGSLKPQYDKICTATIIAEKEGPHTLVGTLSYFNSFETENKTTDSLGITVLPKQLKFSSIIDENVEVKQPFYMNISLNNINTAEEIEVSISTELPSNIRLLKGVEGFYGDTILKRNLKLKPNSIINYSFYLEASSESEDPIKHVFDYTIENMRDMLKNDTFVNLLEPKPIIDFTIEYAEVVPEQRFIVVAKIKNPSRVNELTDIKAELSVPYNKELQQNLNKLSLNESALIFSSIFAMPTSFDFGPDSEKTININLSIKYKLKDTIKSLNNAYPLKIIRVASSSTKTSQESIQSSQEIKTNQTAATQSEITDKPKQSITIIENIKSRFFNKKYLLIMVLVIMNSLVISFTIYRARKRKKDIKQEETSKLTDSAEQNQNIFKPNS